MIKNNIISRTIYSRFVSWLIVKCKTDQTKIVSDDWTKHRLESLMILWVVAINQFAPTSDLLQDNIYKIFICVQEVLKLITKSHLCIIIIIII